MNGRVYDPQIGRFLSADPYIQSPYNTQSYNRYSYVMNNPLKYTDPSGYLWNPFKAVAKAWRGLWRGIKKYGRVIVAAVIAYYTGLEVSSWFIKGAQTALGIGPLTSAVYTQAAILGGAAGGAAFGASNTLLHGGSFSQALDNGLKGAFAGTITGGITGYYGNTWSVERISTSAFAGGASAEMLGGDFKDGFKMALVSSSLRYVYNKMVKYDIDARAGSKGGAADIKGKKGPPIKDYINIGVQDNSASILYEGKPIPRALNVLPAGINAVAGLHDIFQIALGEIGGWARITFNVPGMIPAAYITYGGMIDQYGINSQLVARDRIRK